MKLHPVSYKMKDGDDGINYGFIAQEVEQALGKENINMVLTNNDGIKTKTMRYTELIAPLAKAMQEQQVQIEELRARIKILENYQGNCSTM
jgi:hypothetical protein